MKIFREIVPGQSNKVQQFRDVLFNTDSIQITLQDVKVADGSGGFCYTNSSAHTRNRFIYWRSSYDILELSEESLDVNLIDAHIRFKFVDSPVLNVILYEQPGSVVMLVATVATVHAMSFPHPDKLATISAQSNKAYSIFSETGQKTKLQYSSKYFVSIGALNNCIPHAASSFLTRNGNEAIYALAHTNNLVLFTMSCLTSQTTSIELRQNIVPRIFSNITGALRGKTSSNDGQYVSSVVFNSVDDHPLLYALYRDGNLRVWSTKTYQCLTVFNCLIDEKDTIFQGPQSIFRHVADNTLGIYICNSFSSEFLIIETKTDSNTGYYINKMKSIPAPHYDLIDYEIYDEYIWGLWCNSRGVFKVSTYKLSSNDGTTGWISVALDLPLQRQNIVSDCIVDPRETYCSYIFNQRKFSRRVIGKAFLMFQRSSNLLDDNLSMAVLKDHICSAIECAILKELKSTSNSFEYSNDDYVYISTKYWERFYSCCEQYYIKAIQPICLFGMYSIGTVCILKKDSFSILCPTDGLEKLILSGSTFNHYNLEMKDEYEINDQNTVSDLMELISVVDNIERQLSQEVKDNIFNQLYQQKLPSDIVVDLIGGVYSKDHKMAFSIEFYVEIYQNMKSINNLAAVFKFIFDTIRIDQEHDILERDVGSSYKSSDLHLAKVFESEMGISLLSAIVRQNCLIRYVLCRNLLILQHILIYENKLSVRILEHIRSKCIPDTELFLQTYYVLVQLGESILHPKATENNLVNGLEWLCVKPTNIDQKALGTFALEYFIKDNLSRFGMSIVRQKYPKLLNEQWKGALLPFANVISRLLWPINKHFIFGEWLLYREEHLLIQEYERLIVSWCQTNICSRNFIVAISMLKSGENDKALDLFVQSIDGILHEPFLMKIMLHNISRTTSTDVKIQYYLRLIQLFEQYSALDCVISLALAAIELLDKNDPQMAMFQTIVFSSYLNLKHYSKAYNSLIHNLDATRRKDCLRQLVVSLFEERRLDLLISFPYVRLQEEFENIVESRARSMSIETNIHYEFLYSLNISKGNMRRAALVMYEQAMRFGSECTTIEHMRRRYESLLSCLGALSLVDNKYQWIAKPMIVNNELKQNKMNDDVEFSVMDTDKTLVNILNITDIRKELILIEYVLNISSQKKDCNQILNTDIDAEEVVALLTHSGMYTAALRLAHKFHLNSQAIWENFVVKCIKMDDDNVKDEDDFWNCLQDTEVIDFPNNACGAKMLWTTLDQHIKLYETTSTQIHYWITEKILELSSFLPNFLYTSYYERNPQELLYLFIKHGRLSEATDLAKRHLWKLIKSPEALNQTSLKIYYPSHTIDLLLHSLKINSEYDADYTQQQSELEQIVDHYESKICSSNIS